MSGILPLLLATSAAVAPSGTVSDGGQASATPIAGEIVVNVGGQDGLRKTVAVVGAAPEFTVKAGERLSDVLARWGEAAHYSVVWESERDYLLAADARFDTTDMRAALRDLVDVLARTNPALRVRVFRNNVVVVSEALR